MFFFELTMHWESWLILLSTMWQLPKRRRLDMPFCNFLKCSLVHFASCDSIKKELFGKDFCNSFCDLKVGFIWLSRHCLGYNRSRTYSENLYRGFNCLVNQHRPTRSVYKHLLSDRASVVIINTDGYLERAIDFKWIVHCDHKSGLWYNYITHFPLDVVSMTILVASFGEISRDVLALRLSILSFE